MARNRTIYSNEVLMVAPSATGFQFLNGNKSQPGESLLRQIKRLQSLNFGYAINRTDTYQYGQLARISSVVLQSPVVNLDFSYYLTDGKNEHLLGLDTHDNTNFLKPQLESDADGRNFYIYTSPEGKDAIGSISQIDAQADESKAIVSLGNCYLTNYSANAAVGGIPMASASIEGFNIRSENGRGMTGRSPGIDISNGISCDELGRDFEVSPMYISSGDGVAELMPGDIDIDLGSASLLSLLTDGGDTTAAHIQNFSIDIPMSRTTLQRIGNSFGFSKTIDLPITASISVSAILADRPSTSKSLFTELYENNKRDLTITLKKPSSLGAKKGDKAVVIKVKNATLDAESYGMSIGDNRTVDFSFSATIGEAGTRIGKDSNSYIDINASGVYEQFQVFTTGASTDVLGDDGDSIAYGGAVAANREVLVIGASGFAPHGAGEGDADAKEIGAAYIYKNHKGMYIQANQVSGTESGALAVTCNTANWANANEDKGEVSDIYDWNFGAAVSVSSGSHIAIAAPQGQGRGDANGGIGFYEPNAAKTSWTLTSIIGASDMGYDYGESIAFDKSVSGNKQLFFYGSTSAAPGSTGEAGEVRLAIGTDEAGALSADNYTTSATRLTYGGDLNVGADGLDGHPHNAQQKLGFSVAAHNGVVVAGAPGNMINGNAAGYSGAAFIWVNTQDNGGTTAANQVGFYQNKAVLTGLVWDGNGGAHSKTNGTGPAFGASVDIYKDTIVVGAPSGEGGSAGTASRAGRVFVFTSSHPEKTIWDYSTSLTASDGVAEDHFGNSVRMPNENTIVVGAPGEDAVGADNAGAVYVFTGYGSTWTQTQKISPTGATAADLKAGKHGSLAATQKDIFIGIGSTPTSDEVIRYRI